MAKEEITDGAGRAFQSEGTGPKFPLRFRYVNCKNVCVMAAQNVGSRCELRPGQEAGRTWRLGGSSEGFRSSPEEQRKVIGVLGAGGGIVGSAF